MYRASLTALSLVLASVVVGVPTAAADHAQCNGDPSIPQAVRTGCGIAAGGIHFALVSAELVLDYALCFVTTAPINWADCV